MKKFSALALIVALAVSSCTPQYGPNGQQSSTGGFSKEQIGTVLGGIGGGIAGNAIGKGQGKTVATIGGALLGSMAGNAIGASLDRADMMYLNNSTQGALEGTTTGTVSRWINPDTGNSGTVTPTRTFQNTSGQYCREFSQTIVVGGKSENAFGTACRQSDGSWKVIN